MYQITWAPKGERASGLDCNKTEQTQTVELIYRRCNGTICDGWYDGHDFLLFLTRGPLARLTYAHTFRCLVGSGGLVECWALVMMQVGECGTGFLCLSSREKLMMIVERIATSTGWMS